MVWKSLWLVDVLLHPKSQLPKCSDSQQLLWMTAWEPESLAFSSFHLLASFKSTECQDSWNQDVRQMHYLEAEIWFRLFPIGTKPRYETPHEMRLLFSDKFCSKKPDNIGFQGLRELWEINLLILLRLMWEIVYLIISTEKLKGRRRKEQGSSITKTPGSWPDKLKFSLLSKIGLEMFYLKLS